MSSRVALRYASCECSDDQASTGSGAKFSRPSQERQQVAGAVIEVTVALRSRSPPAWSRPRVTVVLDCAYKHPRPVK